MQKTILRIAYILNIHNKLFLITNAYRNFNKKVNLKMLVMIIYLFIRYKLKYNSKIKMKSKCEYLVF